MKTLLTILSSLITIVNGMSVKALLTEGNWVLAIILVFYNTYLIWMFHTILNEKERKVS